MTSLWHVVWAAPAAVGFAMLFNVHRRALLPVALLAVLARLISAVLVDQGVSIVWADFVAAFVVGAIAYSLAPRTGEASPVYAFAPVIPLFPGVYIVNAMKAMIAWISTDASGADSATRFTAAASSGFTAAAIILVLCLGAISPLLLLPRMRTAED